MRPQRTPPLPPARRVRRGWARLASFFALAALLHLAGALLWRRYDAARPKPAPPPPSQVALRSGAAQRAAVREARRAVARAQEKRTKPERPERLRGQIVQLAENAQAAPPDQADLLARRDARADGPQQVSRAPADAPAHVLDRPSTTQGKRNQAVAHDVASGASGAPVDLSREGMGASSPSASPDQAAPGAAAAQPADATPPAASPRQREAVRAKPRAKGRPTPTGRARQKASESERTAPRPAAESRAQAAVPTPSPGALPDVPGPSGAGRGGPRRTLTMDELVPSVGAVASMVGAPAPDYVPNVALGERTQLNAKAFRYAGFFERVQRQVGGQWRNKAAEALRARDPDRRLYGTLDQVTVLTLTLDAQGALADVTVSQPSDLAFLDDVAVDAVRRAAPFLHPPRGVLDEDGRLRFTFGFHVSTEALADAFP